VVKPVVSSYDCRHRVGGTRKRLWPGACVGCRVTVLPSKHYFLMQRAMPWATIAWPSRRVVPALSNSLAVY